MKVPLVRVTDGKVTAVEQIEVGEPQAYNTVEEIERLEKWMSIPEGTVDLTNTRVLQATPDALRVNVDESSESFWVPKSVVHDDSEVYDEGQHGTLLIQEWWAEKEGHI